MKSALKYLFSNWVRWDKRGTVLAFLRIPVEVLLPFFTALLPKLLVDIVTGNHTLEAIVWMIGVLAVVVIALEWVRSVLDTGLEAFQANISMHYAVEMMEKLLTMDYAVLESYDGRAKFERCRKFAFEGSRADGAWAAVRLTGLLTALLGIVSYLALFSVVDIRLVVLIAMICIADFIMDRKIINIGIKTEDAMVASEMQFYYHYRTATDVDFGKEIRLVGAKAWLLGRLKKAAREYVRIMHRYTLDTTKLTSVQALCAVVRDAIIFGFLIASVRSNELSAGNFILYFGLASGFSDWVNGLSGHIASLRRICVESEKYREFIELPGNETVEMNSNTSQPAVNEIVFDHVSFGYEKGNEVIHDISFKIRKGEALALVGENGAGKSTIVKLLCGLYTPTTGQILFDGQDAKLLPQKKRFGMISAVFQDFYPLPASILSNITLSSEPDLDRVWDALEKAGLSEKIRSLPQGLDTMLGLWNERGVSFSGGEMQRLLLAKAIYKSHAILVLDEPTSMLDPIAEEQLYLSYREIAGDCPSLFCSHRLNSTRFCNHILFIKDGRIAEEGTHEELMRRAGAYREMFDLQGRYYREETVL